MTKKEDSLQPAYDFIRLATDVLVRGRARRTTPAPMATKSLDGIHTHQEPDEDYLDWFFDEGMDPAQQAVYDQLAQQIIDGVLCGDIPLYMPPGYKLECNPTTAALDKGFIKPGDFARWAQRSMPFAPSDWLNQILGSTSTTESKILPRRKSQRPDSWEPVIDKCITEFEADRGATPTVDELWARLNSNPPDGFGIEACKDRGELALAMPGVKPMGRAAYRKRYKRIFPPGNTPDKDGR